MPLDQRRFVLGNCSPVWPTAGVPALIMRGRAARHVQRVVAVMPVVLVQPTRQRGHVEREPHVDGRLAGEPRFDQRFEAAQLAVHDVDAVAARSASASRSNVSTSSSALTTG